VGIIPKILSLKVDLPEVNLALSLHAPTQELRAQIVPAARAFPISKLIAALDSYLVGR
jgi:adenine C2-methylase RlmN of 23S rRNA A2503 and tRNA A37